MKPILIILIILCVSCEKRIKIFESDSPKDSIGEYKPNPERVEDIILSLDRNKKKFGEMFSGYLAYARYNLELMKGASKLDKKLMDLYLALSPHDKKMFDEPANDIEVYPAISLINFVLSKSQVILMYDKPCPASDKADASASVSSFKIGADLCFSISELSKINKHTVDKEILGIIAHEFTHLLGFGENDAILMQNQILRSYNIISDKKDIASALSNKINRVSRIIMESLDDVAYYEHSMTKYTIDERDQFCINWIRSKNILFNSIKFLESLVGKNGKTKFALSKYYNFSTEKFIEIISTYKKMLKEIESIDAGVCKGSEGQLSEEQRKAISDISFKAYGQFQKIDKLFKIY